MVVTILFAMMRVGRGGLGWWTLMWVSFISLLSFVEPIGSLPWPVLHITWVTVQGQHPLKCAREPNFPSEDVGEARALCAEAHHTLSGLSI